MFLFAAGVGIILVALFLNGRDRGDYADFQDRAMRQEGVTNLADLSLVMSDLTDQLNEAANRITSDLDRRANELRELIDAAKQLASNSPASGVNAAGTAMVGTSTTGAGMATAGTGLAGAVASLVTATGVVHEQGAQGKKGAPEDADRPEEEHRPRGSAAWQEKERAVRQLAEQGADVLTIARQLNIGKGEVQLILDLAKSKAR